MARLLRYILIVLVCVTTLLPTFAMAASCSSTAPIYMIPQDYGPFSVAGCAQRTTGQGYGPHEYTSKIVHCIEGTVRTSTLIVMNVVSSYFGGVMAIFAAMVIMFYGIRVAMGEQELQKFTATLAIKLTFVVWFMNNLPALVSWVFSMLHTLLDMVSGGVTPWAQIDTFLGNLLGFGPQLALINGLLGLIGAAAFSSSVGMLMFFTGIMAIMNLLIFIASMIFDYLLAYITIGFLLVFAPITIPLSLFSQTDRYFKKWADLIVAAIISPVMLFAFVWMFLGIFNILIENVFAVLGGHDFKAYWRNNQPLFSWVMPSDPNATNMIANVPQTDDMCGSTGASSARPPVQITSNPFAKNSVDVAFGKTATVYFGANDVGVVTQISMALTTLWIFAMCMKSMVSIIPQLAKGIASASTGIAEADGGSALISKLKGAASGAEGKLDDIKNMKSKSEQFGDQFKKFIGNRDKGKKK